MSETLLGLVERCEQSLEAAGVACGHGTDNAFDEAAWLVAHVAGIDLAEVDELPFDDAVDATVVAAAERLLAERLSSRKPLAYLLNEAWFAGERYYVDERVIVPRSHLGGWILDRFEPWIEPDGVRRILDLCTGSGCIAIALAKQFPAATVVAADISADALAVAARNVELHGVAGQVELRQGDLYAAVAGESFDLVVCNPPYVSDALMAALPAEYRHEPALAFRGGDDGLALIHRLLGQAPDHLAEHGALVVESGSASQALEQAYPTLPFQWLAGDSDEPALFLVEREQLLRCDPA